MLSIVLLNLQAKQWRVCVHVLYSRSHEWNKATSATVFKVEPKVGTALDYKNDQKEEGYS